MTLGQRVAQKRKELGLSQEGLGEQLGVSRQAIYKWESDASLPEIDKLVTLSRIFSVPVGWLLGVEEKPQEEAPGVRVENYGEEGSRSPWGWSPEPPAKVQVGLFRDKKLVMWYEERTEEININGTPTDVPAWFRLQEVELEPGHEYCEALLYTDAYARQRVYVGEAIAYDAGEQRWNSSHGGYDYSQDPADWEF